MKRVFIILAVLFVFSAISSVSAADAVEGYWKSVDEDGKATAFWKFEVKGSTLYGYIVSYPDMKPSDTCEECSGEWKDKPTVGTAWVKLQKRDSKGVWSNGYIIDSGKGKKYGAKVWVDGGKLQVRGSIGPIGRTQVWQRATKEQAEKGF
ncbi:MAG: DUF2147 domain-containing protein [Spirochaetes bacterium]|nr:DUF2147 domain-containing protein [Spirochaetota bacterium]